MAEETGAPNEDPRPKKKSYKTDEPSFAEGLSQAGIKPRRVALVVAVAFLTWLAVPIPVGLTDQAWHLFLILSRRLPSSSSMRCPSSSRPSRR